MNYLDWNVEPPVSKHDFNKRMDDLYSDFLEHPTKNVCSTPVQEVYTAAQARVESDKYVAKTKVISYINTEVKEAAKMGRLCIFIPASQLTEAAIVVFREYGYKVTPNYDNVFNANYPLDLRKAYSGCTITW